MVQLSRERTDRFGDRAQIVQTDGRPELEVDSMSFDRFVSCYVLDLFSQEDIEAVFAEAARIVTPGGLLCTAGLSFGTSPVSRCLSQAWTWLHSQRPMIVGGCRPIEVADLLNPSDWAVRHRKTVTAFGIPSEVVIAERLGSKSVLEIEHEDLKRELG